MCFQKYIISLRRQHSYIVSQIGNADQTAVYFEMSLDTRVHKKDVKNVTVRTGGNEKPVYGNVHYGGWQKIAAVHRLEKEDSAKSECKRCDHPSPKIRLD
jgi:sulfatase maturation enzyme AslB (radical SAM superfamily)